MGKPLVAAIAIANTVSAFHERNQLSLTPIQYPINRLAAITAKEIRKCFKISGKGIVLVKPPGLLKDVNIQ